MRRAQARIGSPQPPSRRERANELCALDDALQALAAIDSRRAQVTELRFFGGLTAEETADVLNVSGKP